MCYFWPDLTSWVFYIVISAFSILNNRCDEYRSSKQFLNTRNIAPKKFSQYEAEDTNNMKNPTTQSSPKGSPGSSRSPEVIKVKPHKHATIPGPILSCYTSFEGLLTADYAHDVLHGPNLPGQKCNGVCLACLANPAHCQGRCCSHTTVTCSDYILRGGGECKFYNKISIWKSWTAHQKVFRKEGSALRQIQCHLWSGRSRND